MARAQIQTNFPAGLTGSRYSSSELIGAYDEMRLDPVQYRAQSSEIPLYHPHAGRPQSRVDQGRPLSEQQPGPSRLPPPAVPGHQRNASYDSRLQQGNHPGYAPISRPSALQPLETPTGSANGQGHGRHSSSGTEARTPTHHTVRYNLPEERVYMPTTVAASTASGTTGRRYDKLADVYSMSGDTVDFARNFGDYVNDRCPTSVWISLTVVFILMGLLLMLFGALNLPFCYIQPMIPVYLLVAGILIMVSAMVRIIGLVPTAKPSGRRKGGLSTALCCHLLEALILLANIIWLILGAVWVYGSKTHVVFIQGMFDDHYCDEGLYWFAFTAVTIQIGLVILAILGLMLLAIFGAFKEAEPSLNGSLDE